MTKKNNVFQLSVVKENRDRLKKAAALDLSPIELVQKEYFCQWSKPFPKDL